MSNQYTNARWPMIDHVCALFDQCDEQGADICDGMLAEFSAEELTSIDDIFDKLGDRGRVAFVGYCGDGDGSSEDNAVERHETAPNIWFNTDALGRFADRFASVVEQTI